jgi:hypothetical protein
MAKSKPIGVRFDLEFLEQMKTELKLETPQKVLNYLFDFYVSNKSKYVGGVYVLQDDEQKKKLKEIRDNFEKQEKYNEYGFKVEKWFSIDNYTKYPKKDRPTSIGDRISWDSEKSFADSLIRTNWEQFQKDNS